MANSQSDFSIEAYDFELPTDRIAQRPAESRDASRLLVLNREERTWSDHRFLDLPGLLAEGDALVLNNTRVIPARLVGHRQTGGKAELLLIERLEGGDWLALANPGRKLQESAVIEFGSGRQARVEETLGEGKRRVRLLESGKAIEAADEGAWLAAVGEMPLPPYIRREHGPDNADRLRYQTIFASERGAVAAPTAGLHLSTKVLTRLEEAGISTHEITLHVGYGTFEPIRETDLRQHRVAPERLTITTETAATLNAVRTRNGRIVAVGTTSTRSLETSADEKGHFSPFEGPTSLTITPGHSFLGTDALITNFHLPRSSLLILVSAFAGREFLLEAYRHAVATGYRFYSYGDCMLIL